MKNITLSINLEQAEELRHAVSLLYMDYDEGASSAHNASISAYNNSIDELRQLIKNAINKTNTEE